MKIAIFEIEPWERQAFEGLGGHPPLGYDIRDRKLVVNPARPSWFA